MSRSPSKILFLSELWVGRTFEWLPGYFAFAILVFGLVAFLPTVHAKPIRAETLSILDFGQGIQGDPAKTVAPGTSENAQNASFLVTGDNNLTYTIILPVSASLITGVGGVNQTIALSTFVSYPPEGPNGLLSGAGTNGTQTVYVGATRAALGLSQAAGSYTGSFSLTVVY